MNSLASLLKSKNLSAAELARRVGKSKSHLSHVMAGRKPVGRHTAIAIFRETGAKLGPLSGLSDDDVAVLARLEGGNA